MAQLSGMVGPQVYQSRFGPSYKVSYSTSVGLLAVTVVSMCLAWFLVHRQDERERLSVSVVEGNTDSSDEKAEGRPQEA